MDYQHQPVLLEEVLTILQPQPGQRFIDATIGGAGYTMSLAQAVGERGLVVGFDLDPLAIKVAEEKMKVGSLNNVLLINDNFSNLSSALTEREIIGQFNGLVLDLGLSSAQIVDWQRGFSFNHNGPLDMAFGPDSPIKTTDIVNHWSEDRLKQVISQYGQEPWAGPLARAIVQYRCQQLIMTSQELVEIVYQTLPKKYLAKSRQHPATKLFQALRIATNQELDNLESVLQQSLDLLCLGGRIAVVSFHSLEDRIVKQFFVKESKDCLCPVEFPICQCDHQAHLKIIYRRPIMASPEEVAANPRSRSAKLRVAEKIN